MGRFHHFSSIVLFGGVLCRETVGVGSRLRSRFAYAVASLTQSLRLRSRFAYTVASLTQSLRLHSRLRSRFAYAVASLTQSLRLPLPCNCIIIYKCRETVGYSATQSLTQSLRLRGRFAYAVALLTPFLIIVLLFTNVNNNFTRGLSS